MNFEKNNNLKPGGLVVKYKAWLVAGLLCRFVTRPSNEHWQDIDRVLRHLKITMNLGLHYQRFPAFLEGYTYATWNTLSDDSKATNEYI